MTLQIIYTGPVVDEVREGMSIENRFVPCGSYIESPAFVDGHKVGVQVGEVQADEYAYGKSVYATNVKGFGELPGLLPLASTPARFALYEQARLKALEALRKNPEEPDTEGISVEIGDDYKEALYWEQMAGHFVDQGFYTKVGDKEFGTKPAAE